MLLGEKVAHDDDLKTSEKVYDVANVRHGDKSESCWPLVAIFANVDANRLQDWPAPAHAIAFSAQMLLQVR